MAPASPTLRGKHVLADIDLVIGGLGNFGPETVQPINLWLPRSRKDASGHTFVGTYLDGDRPATYRNGQNPCNSAPTSRDCVKTMTFTALDAL